MVGTKLEKLGWRQGSLISAELINQLFDDETFASDVLGIIATHSCDIANNDLAQSAQIEISLAEPVESVNGNYTYNKNPRILHLKILGGPTTQYVLEENNFECKQANRVFVDKARLVCTRPLKSYSLAEPDLGYYRKWLAGRYDRPEFPTEFNNMIESVDPKDRRKKLAKKLNRSLCGLYVQIIPDRELVGDEKYAVQMLGLVSDDSQSDLDEIEKSVKQYAEIIRSANIDVKVAVRTEAEVSCAHMRNFKRFNYDYLSLRDDAPILKI